MDNLPVSKSFNIEIVSLIENNIKEIINNLESNPLVSYDGLKLEIDQLVYQLYNLTEEEIAIIENGGK